MKLSVIIVSYNVKFHLEQCIRSVVKASEGMGSDIWVVDNASSDGTVAYLQNIFPDVHYISNAENVASHVPIIRPSACAQANMCCC